MAEAIKEPVLVSRRSSPRPKYRESAYRRSILRRLTPFTWFLIVFCLSGMVVAGLVLVNRIASSSRAESVMLPQRLTELKLADATSLAAQDATPIVHSQATAKNSESSKLAILPATPTVRPSPTVTPAPTPTRNPNDAPWANKLIQQPNGSFRAPQEVIDKVISDLSPYYTMQRDLSVDQYMRQRYDLLNSYFTGPALSEMRARENKRRQYAQNRAGVFLIQVQDFSADGYTAQAGVIKRGWVSDIYNVTSGKLLTEGVAEKDSLSVMTITCDRSSKRWKFASVEVVSEVVP